MLPSTTSRARAIMTLATTSSPVPSARGGEAKHLKYDATCAATGSNNSFRARDDGRPRGLYRDGVLPLRQATAGLGPTGGRSFGQAQEGHLVCAPPGHDRPSY